MSTTISSIGIKDAAGHESDAPAKKSRISLIEDIAWSILSKMYAFLTLGGVTAAAVFVPFPTSLILMGVITIVSCVGFVGIMGVIANRYS